MALEADFSNVVQITYTVDAKSQVCGPVLSYGVMHSLRARALPLPTASESVQCAPTREAAHLTDGPLIPCNAYGAKRAQTPTSCVACRERGMPDWPQAEQPPAQLTARGHALICERCCARHVMRAFIPQDWPPLAASMP